MISKYIKNSVSLSLPNKQVKRCNVLCWAVFWVRKSPLTSNWHHFKKWWKALLNSSKLRTVSIIKENRRDFKFPMVFFFTSNDEEFTYHNQMQRMFYSPWYVSYIGALRGLCGIVSEIDVCINLNREWVGKWGKRKQVKQKR